VAGLYRLRARDADAGTYAAATARFRVPGYPWTPALFVAAALFVVASSVAANTRNAGIGTALLLLGIPVYLWWTRPARRRRASGWQGGAP
jgi:APA family basic amino acid/polyamine antiporter